MSRRFEHAARTESATPQAMSVGRPWSHGIEKHPPPFAIEADQLRAVLREGDPLPDELALELNERLGVDFSRVRIHHDAAAHHVARSLGADAVSFGTSIALRHGRYAPATTAGRELLFHEARHIAAGQVEGTTREVQLAVTIDDVAQEMVGMPFTLRTAQGAPPAQIPAGATVVVMAWSNGPDATVSYTSEWLPITLTVPKLALNPVTKAVPGVPRYDIGVGAQQALVERLDQNVTDQRGAIVSWRAAESKYVKNHRYWERHLRRMEQELTRRKRLQWENHSALSDLIVRGVMYNRFDESIARWVNIYNTTLRPDTPLDPSIVKSMIFNESRFGTHGEHLELPPYDWYDEDRSPIRSRFNLMQAIDSAAPEQMLMIEEMAPHIYMKYNLNRLKLENRRRGMSEDEMFAWNGGALGLAAMEFFAARDSSGRNAMGAQGRSLHEDYDYWIRTGVRWLFFKYQNLPEGRRSWPEAVRAYNGAGSRASAYRDDVMSRVPRRNVSGAPGWTVPVAPDR